MELWCAECELTIPVNDNPLASVWSFLHAHRKRGAWHKAQRALLVIGYTPEESLIIMRAQGLD